MIKLITALPDITERNAEITKIRCLYDCYHDDDRVLFWAQNGTDALISLADGNMTVYNHTAEITELSEFIKVMSPVSLFSDYNTLKILGLPAEKVCVMYCDCDNEGANDGDTLNSREIYDLLKSDEFMMPEYSYFAVDFCRRLNRSGAQYYAVSGKCAAVSINSGDSAVLNGIVSREKGMGSVALSAIQQKNNGRRLFACCRKKLTDFYLKNGFKMLYYAGYWVKTDEHKQLF